MISRKKKNKKNQNVVCYQQVRIILDAHNTISISLMELHNIFQKQHNLCVPNLKDLAWVGGGYEHWNQCKHKM